MIDKIFNIGLHHYLILALILFTIGVFGTIVSRNIIKILISIEIILTSININFIAFSTYIDSIKLEGYVMSIFYVALGATELAIALSIFYLMYKHKNSPDSEDYTDLKG